MTDFPTVPGSLIRATVPDRPHPSPFMLLEPDVLGGVPMWMHPDDEDAYPQHVLTLLAILHDEGRAQLLESLPDWDSLTDVDKGCALMHAWKVDAEGHEYAVENYPAKFFDHPVLTQLTPDEACGYVDVLGFDLGLSDAVRFNDDREESGPENPGREMTWDEFHRLYNLALDTESERRRGAAS